LSLEWKREGVMDNDSGDEGNDELTCQLNQIESNLFVTQKYEYQ